jgi:hypothetical protein
MKMQEQMEKMQQKKEEEEAAQNDDGVDKIGDLEASDVKNENLQK